MKILENKKKLKVILIIILFIFAGIGVIFSGVFVAMRLHLTDVKGSIDSRNEYFNQAKNEIARFPTINKTDSNTNLNKLNPEIECQIMTILTILPTNGEQILDAYMKTRSDIIAMKMIDALVMVTSDSNQTMKNEIDKCSEVAGNSLLFKNNTSDQDVFGWVSSPEWQTLKDALVKDKDFINQASHDSGVPSRIIVSTVISEQFRFFTANRESYKKFFEPLKVLGNGTKFSYGVAGVKFETAKVIESNLKDKNSPFYLGSDFEDILNYGDRDPDLELMARLTDNKNHYYSYLYTALFLKQVMTQWQNAGYQINDRPEVLSTLFNLGFSKSVPKANPDVGGSTITINNHDYTFGGLSYEFYYGGELSDIFPFEVQ